MIKPTVGRKIWFYPHVDETEGKKVEQPHSAEIVFVVDEANSIVNIAAFNHTGALYSKQHVKILQDGESPPWDGHFATWMPFQIGQARSQASAGADPAAIDELRKQLDSVTDGVKAATAKADAAVDSAAELSKPIAELTTSVTSLRTDVDAIKNAPPTPPAPPQQQG